MKDYRPNEYEQAFENWLIDNGIQYIRVDEHKRAAFARHKVKSFDFLVYPRTGQVILAEIKGRKFKGTSLAQLTGLECWVTADDIEGLSRWREVFGPGHLAVFVFAYKIEHIDVDFDGREPFNFVDDRYVFFCVKLDDYIASMKRRSPKWQTVTLPAKKFRQQAMEVNELLD